jgi:hypothetical protein
MDANQHNDEKIDELQELIEKKKRQSQGLEYPGEGPGTRYSLGGKPNLQLGDKQMDEESQMKLLT